MLDIFIFLNCFHSFRTEKKLKNHKHVCKNQDYCYAEMFKKDNEILKYNHGKKSMKVPFFINVDMEYLLEKMSTCHNNPKKSSTTKISKHTVIHHLHIVHLIQQNISLIPIEIKTT